MKPYLHQDIAVKNALSKLVEQKNHLFVAPTGTGKTACLAWVVDNFLKIVGKDKNILCLIHRDVINGQNASAMKKLTNRSVTFFDSRIKQCGQVTMGMVQTVRGEIKKMPRFDMVMIDECHFAMADSYIGIIEHQKELAKKDGKDFYLYGTTATPNRGDGESLLKLFTNFHQIDIAYLIQNGFLVKPLFVDKSPTVIIDGKQFIGRLSKLTLDEKAEMLYSDYVKEAGKKSVVFCSCHRDINYFHKYFEDRGIKSLKIADKSNHDDRIKTFKLFEDLNSGYDVLFNVDICTAGYDYPEIDTVILMRQISEDCKGLFIQIVGRGLRTIDPKLSKTVKNFCKVLDFGGNYLQFGDLSQEVLTPQDGENKDGLSLNDILGDELTEKVLFDKQKKEEDVEVINKQYANYKMLYENKYPNFEMLDDSEIGLCAICVTSKEYAVLIGDKGYYSENKKDWVQYEDSSLERLNKMVKQEQPNRDKAINDMQIKVIGASHSVRGCNFYRANCIICLELLKKKGL